MRPFGSVSNGKPNAAGATIGALVASRSPAAHNNHNNTNKRSSTAAVSGGEASNTSLGDATDSNDCSGLPSFLDPDGSSMGATSDSKDSQLLAGSSTGAKDDLPKEWFYDDMDMHEMDALEEPKSPADDEFDYDPRYGHKKKKRRPAAAPKRSSGGVGGGHHGKGGSRRSAASAAAAGDGLAGTPKPRSSSSRRKSAKKAGSATAAAPVSPTSIVEPPSFEMAAAAVQGATMGDDELGSYRKYL